MLHILSKVVNIHPHNPNCLTYPSSRLASLEAALSKCCRESAHAPGYWWQDPQEHNRDLLYCNPRQRDRPLSCRPQRWIHLRNRGGSRAWSGSAMLRRSMLNRSDQQNLMRLVVSQPTDPRQSTQFLGGPLEETRRLGRETSCSRDHGRNRA